MTSLKHIKCEKLNNVTLDVAPICVTTPIYTYFS